MLNKDLVKEGWIRFAYESDLNEEMPNIELARRVFESMKNCGMHNVKPNKNLEKRWNELSTFKRELEDIKNISIVRNANVNCKYDLINNYLIIEDKYGPNVVLDLNNGRDESYRFSQLFLTKNTKIEKLYSSIKKSEPIQLSKIEKVIYYPKATLINDFTKTKVLKGYLLEISDTLNNKLYVDCYNKNLFYDRNNYSVINNNKKIELFNNGLSINIPNHILGLKHYAVNMFRD